jgi:hypothetical protein
MLLILNIKDIGRYLPIQEFFKIHFMILKDLYQNLQKSFKSDKIIKIDHITKPYSTWKDDILNHLEIMRQDFQSNKDEMFQNEIAEMITQKALNLKYWNMQMGLCYLEKLDKYVCKPLKDLIKNKIKKIRLFRKLLILAKKLEYLNEMFFRVHLTSFYNVALDYDLPNNSDQYKEYVHTIVIL